MAFFVLLCDEMSRLSVGGGTTDMSEPLEGQIDPRGHLKLREGKNITEDRQ